MFTKENLQNYQGLDGGNSALVIGLLPGLVESNFEGSKTLYLKAIQSLKNGLDQNTITKARFPLHGARTFCPAKSIEAPGKTRDNTHFSNEVPCQKSTKAIKARNPKNLLRLFFRITSRGKK